MSIETTPTAALEAAVGVSRIALGVEYKGSNYHGFQLQVAGTPSVQGCLEEALQQINAGRPVRLSCAGRTDAMVHACGQVIHFDTDIERPMRAWVMGANRYLPKDISVVWAQSMPLDFHSRFSAVARRYRYVIYSDEIRPAHLAEEVTWTHQVLDIEKMRAAARCFVGTHNFNAVRASGCQAHSPVRTIHHLQLFEFGKLIIIDVRANAFLHHMVRNLAGILMMIGAGERPVEWAQAVLESCDRKAGGVTAPPHGLYMVQVEYPEQFKLPERYLGPHFLSGLPDSFADK
ncbi:tRNA pseudouridine(38-40) synthase TruA [Pseudomonas sp. C27(2019)]|uniref:tRNA pseudouridine(38-40) synthase TruA n=1 Tax=Pseudomonas sp. C27(2019) TaxID=2604941 RepID=UPI0012456CA2|nr:tRNA pseudouridine(38-40) synthase TruA [Pseudomonas sp. C27(2019)]QEY58848.1 tRNA pseudouridine(38-40) synthase TruA [Pseudomonas sp. C27(2019)]